MTKDYIAVIQAGGKGSRMISLTKDIIPKPMLALCGKTMLEWQISDLAANGIRDVVIITGHLGEKIEDYFCDGSRYGVRISYIREDKSLGSAGALYYLKDKIHKDFILIYGDVMFELDWGRMLSFFEKKDATAVLLAHPNAHPYDSDLLVVDSDNRVTGILSKKEPRLEWYKNCVNAGIFVLKSHLMDIFDAPEKKDLEQDILIPLIQAGKVYAYRTPEYVKDVGTPERFAAAERELTDGIWKKKCLKNKQKCIFMDRDGTVNKYAGLVSKAEEFVLEDTAVEAIRKINGSGYLAIIVTNQPVVARGLCEISDVELIHRKMETLLGQEGAYLDDIVFCPHHPDRGYPEENPLYKVECDCRKPQTGMIDRMIKKYNIDPALSWIIGDTTTDIQTGVNAGLNTVLIHTGASGKDRKFSIKADLEAADIQEAVEMIMQYS